MLGAATVAILVAAMTADRAAATAVVGSDVQGEPAALVNGAPGEANQITAVRTGSRLRITDAATIASVADRATTTSPTDGTRTPTCTPAGRSRHHLDRPRAGRDRPRPDDDILTGQIGRDVIHGDAGFDTADYLGHPGA